MTRQEIDNMMKNLPSQRNRPTVAGEILAGFSFTLFVVMICLL